MPSPDDIAKTRQIIANIRLKAVPLVTYIKLFTQTPAGEAYAILDANGVPGGICCALSLHWLDARASGKDYMDTILGLGGTVKVDAIQPAIDMQKDFTNPETQLQKAKAWLEKKGFKTAQKPMTSINMVTNGVGSWFAQSYSEGGPYRLLGTRGFNHATALDLSNADDLAFIDPNLGSLHFNSAERLKKFLDETIFPSNKDQWGNMDCNYIGRKRVSLLEMIGCNR